MCATTWRFPTTSARGGEGKKVLGHRSNLAASRGSPGGSSTRALQAAFMLLLTGYIGVQTEITVEIFNSSGERDFHVAFCGPLALAVPFGG